MSEGPLDPVFQMLAAEAAETLARAAEALADPHCPDDAREIWRGIQAQALGSYHEALDLLDVERRPRRT